MMIDEEINPKFEREMIDSYRTAVDTFYKDKTKIHFKLKNGVWGNGFIIRVSDEFFIVDDDKVGEQTLFYSQLRMLNINVNRKQEVLVRKAKEGVKIGIFSLNEHKDIGVTLKITKTKLLEESVPSKAIKKTISLIEEIQSLLQEMLEKDYGELEDIKLNNIYLEGGEDGMG